MPHRRAPSSEELFGDEPFTYGPMSRYCGTGAAGYRSGAGFTGGYYGFGEDPPLIPTELERKFLGDLYGPDGRIAAQSGPQPPFAPARRAAEALPAGPEGLAARG